MNQTGQSPNSHDLQPIKKGVLSEDSYNMKKCQASICRNLETH